MGTRDDAWKRVIRLLKYRPRTVAEIRQRLSTAGVDHEEIEDVVLRGQETGLLDDAAFTRLWVEDRLLHRPLSRRAVERELLDKGIHVDTARRVIGELYTPEAERRIAFHLAEERFNVLAGVDDERRARRTVDYLTRRGFDRGLTAGIVRELTRRSDEVPTERDARSVEGA